MPVNLENVPTVLDVPFYGGVAQSSESFTHRTTFQGLSIAIDWTPSTGTARAQVAGCVFHTNGAADLDDVIAQLDVWLDGIDW